METPFIPNQNRTAGGVVKSRPVPVSELWSYVAARKLATDGGLQAEYKVGYACNFAQFQWISDVCLWWYILMSFMVKMYNCVSKVALSPS
jgi:hypothetical protein